MNTRRWMMGLLVACLMVVAPMLASADVLELEPVEARVLPADGSGLTKVALRFDLSGMREGKGRRIYDALLDWRVTGVSGENPSEFTAHAATSSWSVAGDSPDVAEDPVAGWDVIPDSKRADQLVRLDLRGLVEAWSEGKSSNYGIVVVTPNLSTTAVSTQLAKAKLTIRYSFIID